MEYWIDGYFHEDWNSKTYFSHDRGVFVPKFATIKLESDRIYITRKFARSILRKGRVFDSTKKYDMFDMILQKIINVPWVKEPYVEPEPRFKVSLP